MTSPDKQAVPEDNQGASADKLKSCPFCGGEAEHDPYHYSGKQTPVGNLIRGHAIYCADIGCIGCPPFSHVWDDDEGGFEAAAEAWNTRNAKGA